VLTPAGKHAFQEMLFNVTAVYVDNLVQPPVNSGFDTGKLQFPTEIAASVNVHQIGSTHIGQHAPGLGTAFIYIVYITIRAQAENVLRELQGNVIVSAHGDVIKRLLFFYGQGRREFYFVGCQDTRGNGQDDGLAADGSC